MPSHTKQFSQTCAPTFTPISLFTYSHLPFPVSPKPPQPHQVGIYTRSPSQTPTSAPEGYSPLPVPDARALNHPLDLLKALKPLLGSVTTCTGENFIENQYSL